MSKPSSDSADTIGPSNSDVGSCEQFVPPQLNETDLAGSQATEFSDASKAEESAFAADAQQSSVLAVHDFNKSRHDKSTSKSEHNALHLATSTFLSLVMVLFLLLIVRWMVPGLVESIRYSWHRGQLRAEYEVSGEELTNVSLKSIEAVSELVSRRVGPSVVHINLSDIPSLKTAQGSGFVISSDGYILTNHHVIDGSRLIEVTFADGRVLNAEIVGEDPLTDLAVLRVDAEGLLAAEWGNSQTATVGAPVWAVGSPFGFQHTVSFGIISGKHRVDFGGAPERTAMKSSVAPLYGDLMQSDVVLHPGNSGGPLVNSSGQIVGVNSAILGDTFKGISFAIPSRVARRVAEDLISDGRVKRGWLGVQLRDFTELEINTQDEAIEDGGVVIVGFPQGLSPARKSGLRRGDIIIEFNGTKVQNQKQLMILIADARAGTEVDVVVIRGDKRVTSRLKLAERTLR